MINEYRKYFNSFKRTNEYRELQSYLIRKQLGLCISCRKPINLNKDTHCYHCISIFDALIVNRKDLTTNYNNFYLSCNSCNYKQSKNSNFIVLKEDVLKLLSLGELAKIVYYRKYKLNLKQLCIY